ncbi:histidine phosphatase family protein [Antrihabitans sp. YC2-6]|uniref:histidine phosphatase family protein n=1 Tax=Antrihabitans sp. YC2-6 TaxID=2799498 RepID=UPI0018F5BE53|nr:histidine phosphatase family protein [Antrihabitans sp. YC2-6]MBJ8346366.1 histidine phosphatase family protein [Antrihabitans sp. YC2-6]
MQLLLIRHALPSRIENAAEGADPGLAPTGVEQAARVPAAIDRHRIVRIVSSPQLRAQETAKPTAEKLGLDVGILDGLAEYDHGNSFYIPIEQAKHDFPEMYERIKNGHLPEVVDGQAFKQRVLDAVQSIVETTDHADTVAAFAHGGVINTYVGDILDIEKRLAFPIDYCSVTRILFSRNGKRTVASVNETSHVWDLLPRNIASS